MGILPDDVVIIRQSEKERDLSVITVNCPDKTGLGCDLCRIILFFGLNIVKGDLSTDGKWCYIVFWVAGNSSTRWGLLKKRLLGESSLLPTKITDDMLHLEIPDELQNLQTSSSVSVTMDNSLSPAHTLVQIACQDHKGLLYDILRTLKDYNIKTSYGRFTIKQRRNCEIDLFIVQADGKKIVDPNKQRALSCHLEMELLRPLRVAVVSRGPDTELLVANPVELSGKGRPLVFHDITLALKMLKSCIFSAEIRRNMIGDREFEVYRVLLDEGESLPIPRSKIEGAVWNMLMGWD
ncbi:hypothetical protein GH714_038986 [Hevea brasiliensis]|uniref:ACT domain-containing protein ACR n=1 Tax=Hevea brasiliensis TaxID=3981 RepID=A0A6A6KNM5_HEVBR|nr:hypothetical protein GH714_038986 [Hevea brasiliensis]